MAQPLTGWEDTPTTQAILDFVDEVTTVGGAEQAMKRAATRGWTVISMKTDWKRVFAFQDVSRVAR